MQESHLDSAIDAKVCQIDLNPHNHNGDEPANTTNKLNHVSTQIRLTYQKKRSILQKKKKEKKERSHEKNSICHCRYEI